MTTLDDSARAAATVLSFDTACHDLVEVERLLAGLSDDVDLPADATVCTHVVPGPGRRYAISVATPTPASAELVEQLRARLGRAGYEPARAEVRAGHGGRAVYFPGCVGLHGTVSIADALAGSAIDRVQVLGGRAPSPDDRLETRDFVRPLFRFGELVLPVLVAGPHLVRPFESPRPAAGTGGWIGA